MATNANLTRVLTNGYDITTDGMQSTANLNYAENSVMAWNIGIQQAAVGIQDPKLQLGGYVNTGQAVLSAFNLLFPVGIGGVNDTEYIVTILLPNNAVPAAGDGAILADCTLLNFDNPRKYQDVQTYKTSFDPRGNRWGMGHIIYDNTLATTKGSQTSAVFDSQANAVGLSKGVIVHTQITTPTGTAATGNVSLNGQPANNDKFTLTIGGVAYAYTFKTALTPAAGEVLIGATTAATIANLFSAMVGSQSAGTVGTTYATGTVAIPQYPQSTSLVYVKPPTSTNVVNLQAVATGANANAYTLVATTNTSGNLAVSGATMAGGVAGDTITSLVFQSATTSGGSYTTFLSSALTGTTQTAERLELATGTVVNRFIRAQLTMSASTSNIGLNVSFARFYQL